MKTKVYIRSNNLLKDVEITDVLKPSIDELMVDKWQHIIDIVAEILDVPAGLIMRITKESMQVFLKSSNRENPYEVGGEDTLGKGLYCESVVGSDQELLVPNALTSEVWKDNPDAELNMISYYGLPIHWPDQSYFGTICVLDTRENHFNDLFKKLMNSFCRAIEDDLKLLVNQQKLDFLANRDHLTGTYNHDAIYKLMEDELKRSQRSKNYFSIVFLDIDNFSNINQAIGYVKGDQLLVALAKLLEKEVRGIDLVGRWSSDEFLIICPNTNESGAKKVVEKLKATIVNHQFLEKRHFTCSFGYCAYTSVKDTVEYMISKAIRQLQKEKKKNQ